MAKTINVFYSWQTDLPNNTNRSFIEQALQLAAKDIIADVDAEIHPVIDRDTAGVPGSPDIRQTIFSKIEASEVFVADVSIIGQPRDRFVCNPNVLVELGYALKTLGHSRVLLLHNDAFGRVEDLPFDLRGRRVITYAAEETQPDKSVERRRVAAILGKAIREIARKEPNVFKPPPSVPQSIASTKPIWIKVYDRKGDPYPWVSESPPERRWGHDPVPSPLDALVARFSATRYVSDVRARLTYLDATGKEFASRRGLWLETDSNNEITMRAGDVPALVMFLYADDGGMSEYAIPDDKRQVHTQTYAPIGFDPCPVTDGWSVRASLFHNGKAGSEHAFECFTGSNGRIQVRNVQTKESSD